MTKARPETILTNSSTNGSSEGLRFRTALFLRSQQIALKGPFATPKLAPVKGTSFRLIPFQISKEVTWPLRQMYMKKKTVAEDFHRADTNL